MNSFETMDELWLDACEQVFAGSGKQESRDGDVDAECLGYVGRLEKPWNNFIFNPVRRMCPAYAAAEVIWYLSGEQTIDRILPYSKAYQRFANKANLIVDDEGCPIQDSKSFPPMAPRREFWVAPGAAYGWRLQRRTIDGLTQIASLIRHLDDKPESRQGVIGIWDPDYDMAHTVRQDLKSIPCTLSLNFIIRDGRLNLVTTMRSNDLWLGMPYDVFAFTCIQRMIADSLRIPMGWYQHQATSLHCYSRNAEKARAAMDPPAFNVPTANSYTPCHIPHEFFLAQECEKLVMLEQANRTGVAGKVIESYIGKYTLFHDLSLMAATKWDRRAIEKLESTEMRKYCEAFYRERDHASSGDKDAGRDTD